MCWTNPHELINNCTTTCTFLWVITSMHNIRANVLFFSLSIEFYDNEPRSCPRLQLAAIMWGFNFGSHHGWHRCSSPTLSSFDVVQLLSVVDNFCPQLLPAVHSPWAAYIGARTCTVYYPKRTRVCGSSVVSSLSPSLPLTGFLTLGFSLELWEQHFLLLSM